MPGDLMGTMARSGPDRVPPLDLHTPCVACPQPVRRLHDAAAALLGMIELTETPVGDGLRQLVMELALATGVVRRYVEAHTNDQRHAWSPDLHYARHPDGRGRPTEEEERA